jgi:hypothetical protein
VTGDASKCYRGSMSYVLQRTAMTAETNDVTMQSMPRKHQCCVVGR